MFSFIEGDGPCGASSDISSNDTAKLRRKCVNLRQRKIYFSSIWGVLVKLC